MGDFIRLQKILAQAGFGSRRACETFILEGRVTVDGAVVRHLGTKADPETQVVTLDGEKVAGPGKAGKRLHEQGEKVYYALNKPTGVLCTNDDPSGRPLAIQMIPEKRRLFCVGRLDLDTEGLLLLTNDGELTHLLTHPRFGVPKTYMAKVDGPVSGFQLAKLKKGVFLAEGRTQGALVRVRKHGKHTSSLEVTIQEGLNRQVRRMLAAVGLQCRSLRRVKIGPLSLGAMPTGAYRLLGRAEVEALRRASQASGKPQVVPEEPQERDEETTGSEWNEERAPEQAEREERVPRRDTRDDYRQRQGSAERRPWERRPEQRERQDRDDRGRAERPQRDERPNRDDRRERHDRNEGRPPQGRQDQRPRPDRGDRYGQRPRPEGRRDEGRYGPREQHGGERHFERPQRRDDRERRNEGRPPQDRYDQRPRPDRGDRYGQRPRPEGRRDEGRYGAREQHGGERRFERPQRRDDRERRDEGRPPQGRYDQRPRPDRGDRYGQRPRPEGRRDEGERRSFQPRSGYQGKPRDRGTGRYDRGAAPHGHGGQGARPWQKRKDHRQGGQRPYDGRRDQGPRREEY